MRPTNSLRFGGQLARPAAIRLSVSSSERRLVSSATTRRRSPRYAASRFGDALRRMARYKQLTCPEEIRSLTPTNGECAVEFRWLLARDAEPAVLVDLCLSWILSIGRRGIGAPISPLRLELTRMPTHRALIETHFGCRARFKAGRNALIFRRKRPRSGHLSRTMRSCWRCWVLSWTPS